MLRCQGYHMEQPLWLLVWDFQQADVLPADSVKALTEYYTESVYLSDQSEYYTKFLFNTGFNTEFNLKDKVILEFGIILSFMLIISSNAVFNTEFKTKISFEPKLSV